ncbi:uncharacterized protein LOC120630240 [Pararge aegeria]|uniref:uncharacterized protein LOC120630240 n=1 Tax=Pararge aegeria TaxID=116150 RepID=UPI0019D12B46|nr:uncharacterized protein LOC120630240 [Pararge aegeria]
MRSIFLISAILLHVSWCYALPEPSWFPGYFNYFPGFINRYKLEEETTDKISGLNDAVDSKPGVPNAPGQYFSSVSHTSVVTGTNGVVHKDGETIINNNGKITKFKY